MKGYNFFTNLKSGLTKLLFKIVSSNSSWVIMVGNV